MVSGLSSTPYAANSTSEPELLKSATQTGTRPYNKMFYNILK